MSSQSRAFMVGGGGWGGGLSNNIGRHAWPMLKKLKKNTD